MSKSLVSGYQDRARATREGEELPLEPLRAYLAELLGGAEELAIEQFPGGHSNLTYLLRYGKRELVLRRPPFGSKVKRAHDMGREFRFLSKLGPAKPWAPTPLGFCDDPAVIGAEFYLLERLRGVILRRGVPAGLTVDEPMARRLSETLLDVLIELHDVDYEAIGLGDLGRPNGFVERQVRGWTRRYDDARTEDIPEMPSVAKWLAANLPKSQTATIIHNDYKFDNVMYDSERFERIIGVLDWEMTTLGDPLIDLGTSLCYWVEKADGPALQNLSFAPTMLPGMATRSELAERYASITGRDLSDIVFYYSFGLFKTAVVLQQIYYRYHQGLTKDPRFAALNLGVRLLAEKAAEHIERRSL